MSDLLVFLDNCPVCGFTSASATNCPGDLNRAGGWRYLQPMADDLKLDLSELTKTIDVYQCVNCQAHYLNPWFSVETRNRIFLSGHPIHNMGWSNFVERIASQEKPTLPMQTHELIDAVESRIGNISSYAELGCPFMGLLLRTSQQYEIKNWLRLSRSFGAMPPASFKLLPQALVDYMSVSSWSSNLAKIISRLRMRKRQISIGRINPIVPSRTSIRERYFLSIPSTKSWGLNCSGFGESCTSVAHTALGAKVATLSDLDSAENRTIDLIGIFLMLDHQDSPLELLAACLSKSKGVLVLTHGGPFSVQHHIGLGETFFTNLPNLIPGLRVDRIGSKESDVMFLLYQHTDR